MDWVIVGAEGGRASGETENGPNIDDNQWHHIAFVYDRGSKVSTYVDGVQRVDCSEEFNLTTHDAVKPGSGGIRKSKQQYKGTL